MGDRVGIWSPNHAEWTLVQFATAKIGAILVNINPAYRTNELAYALNQSGCRWLIAAPTFKTSDYVAMVDEVRAEVPSLERTIFFWSPEWEALWAAAEEVPRRPTLARAPAAAPARRPDQHPVHVGHDGLPQGRHAHPPQHPQQRLLRRGSARASRSADRLCIPVPFYHCFGMVMGNLGCVTHGATMVIPNDGFDPLTVLETVEAERCTALYGVPTMFIAELGHPDFDRFDLSSLRTGVMAGSPCPVEVMKQCVDRMHIGEVTICYGMTETSPVSTQTDAERLAAPPDLDGRAGPPPRGDQDRRPRDRRRRSRTARRASSARGATR